MRGARRASIMKNNNINMKNNNIKRWITLIVAVMFVLGVTGMTLASPEVKEASKIKGKITAINEEAGTITIKSKTDEEVEVVIPAKDLKKAKEGMIAKVSYHEEDGKNVADKVSIKKKRKIAEGC